MHTICERSDLTCSPKRRTKQGLSSYIVPYSQREGKSTVDTNVKGHEILRMNPSVWHVVCAWYVISALRVAVHNRRSTHMTYVIVDAMLKSAEVHIMISTLHYDA